MGGAVAGDNFPDLDPGLSIWAVGVDHTTQRKEIVRASFQFPGQAGEDKVELQTGHGGSHTPAPQFYRS